MTIWRTKADQGHRKANKGQRTYVLPTKRLLIVILFVCSSLSQGSTQLPNVTSPFQQSTTAGQKKSQPPKRREEILDTDAIEAQRQAFAISLITTLSDEARSFKDMKLRPRVLARAADALWESDKILARNLFRRAWDAAEQADAEDAPAPSTSKGLSPAMIIVLRSGSSSDLRSEVLNLVARRDRALAEEFLGRLEESKKRAAGESPDATSDDQNDSWSSSDETSKRLTLAHRLLDDKQPERAFELAVPVLNRVNEKAISFLSRLRLVKPELADKQFGAMLAAVDANPFSDANTVSGLSSYAFTPGFYVTCTAEGSVRWTPNLHSIQPPLLDAALRNAFFRVAGNILLRPSPPVDQDKTSAGRAGRHFVIKRLLPLFEQYAPETAVALKSQLVALSESVSNVFVEDGDFLLTQGITETDPRTILDQCMSAPEERRTSEYGMKFLGTWQRFWRQRAMCGPSTWSIRLKITPPGNDSFIRHYLSAPYRVFQKGHSAAGRFAAPAPSSHVQRSWAYTQIARLLMGTSRTRASEMLEQALAEARRIDADDPHRVSVMFGIAYTFLQADPIRSWEVAAEAFRAANNIEQFGGEEVVLRAMLMTTSGLKTIELDVTGFDLTSLSRRLAKEDFIRAQELAKSLKYESPRAVATLAVAGAVLAEP